MSALWQPWSVPRDWAGERCFILCGGESIRAQRKAIRSLKGRIIAIKEGVLLRPDADVLFLGGENTPTIALPLIPKFKGRHVVLRRGKACPEVQPLAKCVARTKDHSRLCDIPTHVAGYDSGTSAINLAYHFGATEIIVLGMDMTGNRWFNGEHPHPMPTIPESHHVRHAAVLPSIAADAKTKGIRIVNVSPVSRIECFERGKLEAFL